MVIYVFAEDGACLWIGRNKDKVQDSDIQNTYSGQVLNIQRLGSDPYPEAVKEDVQWNGQEMEMAPGPDEIFLHTGITAPGSGPTGVPSVAADETATVNATLRAGVDPESAVIPYTGTVRAPYYMNGAYHGELRMIFAAGECAYTFEPKSHHHGTLTINEDEIGLLQEKKIRLVGEAKLIVDEKSAA